MDFVMYHADVTCLLVGQGFSVKKKIETAQYRHNFEIIRSSISMLSMPTSPIRGSAIANFPRFAAYRFLCEIVSCDVNFVSY